MNMKKPEFESEIDDWAWEVWKLCNSRTVNVKPESIIIIIMLVLNCIRTAIDRRTDTRQIKCSSSSAVSDNFRQFKPDTNHQPIHVRLSVITGDGETQYNIGWNNLHALNSCGKRNCTVGVGAEQEIHKLLAVYILSLA